MLVNDRKEIETLGCHLSSNLFGCNLNSSEVVMNSDYIVKPFHICREEVGFFKYSELGNTHNSNIQEVLKTWCM